MTMMGPNIAATLAVPRLCAANRAIRITTVNGTTKSLNARTLADFKSFDSREEPKSQA